MNPGAPRVGIVHGGSRIVRGNGYYGRGLYRGHSYYVGTHGWRGYHIGYRWGYHRFWRHGIWIWDYGYYYDPYYVGPLFYFDDGYVPDEIAPQPQYAPDDQQVVPDQQVAPDEQPPPAQQPQPEQPQPEQQQPAPQQREQQPENPYNDERPAEDELE